MRINIMETEYLLFSSIVWCTFTGTFAIHNFIIGALLGRLFSRLSLGFLREEIEKSNNKNFSITLYMLRLMVDIYMNTFSLILLLFRGRLDPGLVKVRVKGRGKVSSLIANSITLTPKTSCVDKEGNLLTVLCAHHMDKDEILNTLEIRTLKEKDLIPDREYIKGVES